MARHPPSIRPAIGHDHAGRHRFGIPAEVMADPACEPALAIERPEQLAHVDDLGLELDHEQRPSRRMPGEKVDDTTFALAERAIAVAPDRPLRRAAAERVWEILEPAARP